MKEITKVWRGKEMLNYVFDSTTEAITYLTGELSYLNVNHQDLSNPLTAFKRWCAFKSVDVPSTYKGKTVDFSLEGPKRFDWVKTDDGCIVQILNLWNWCYGRFKTGNPRFRSVVKVAFGVYFKSSKAAGDFTIRIMLAYPSTLAERTVHRSAIGTHHPFKDLGIKQKLFAYYLIVYGDPITAYYKSQGTESTRNGHTNVYASKEALKQLTNPYVIKEILKYMPISDFRSRLEIALKDNKVEVEELVKEFAEGLKAARKGSLPHKQFLEMGFNLTRFANDETATLDGKIKPKGENLDGFQPPQQIENAQFEDVLSIPPPRKEIKDKIDEETKALVEDSIKLAEEVKEKQFELEVDSEEQEIRDRLKKNKGA